MSAQMPTVQTTNGPVRGVRDDGISRFLGIPYAAPLEGDARWEAPGLPEPWVEPRCAATFGPTAPSAHGANPAMLPVVAEPHVDGAGYLNANVWTRDVRQSRPVLVWIHGGGYFGGCSANPWYDGTSFADAGLVFVSFNYRLAAEGFAALPESPDNRGVLDWIAALEWVRDNVARFGGDPSRVTVFGQSAGGFSVANLLGCERARGLFHQAIIASGISDSSTISLSRARQNTDDLERILVSGKAASDLRSASSQAIVEAQTALEQARGNGAVTPTLTPLRGGLLSWAPVRDGGLIRTSAVDGECLHLSDDIPVLVGNTADEFGWSYTLADPADPRGRVLADRFMRRPTQRFVNLRTHAEAPTYRYEFRWRSRAYQGRAGAAHSLDIPFFFNTLSAPYVREFTGDDPPQALADAMHSGFAKFALDGDPGWPRTGQRARTPRWCSTTTVSPSHSRFDFMIDSARALSAAQLVLRERQCRDRGWFREMRSYYWPDSFVRVSWFNGSGPAFVDQSKCMSSRGQRAFHSMGAPVVRECGSRLLVEVPASINFLSVANRVVLSARSRIVYRLEEREDAVRIKALDTVYEDSAYSDGNDVSHEELTGFRASYSALAHHLQRNGTTVDADLLGEDRPAQLQAFYDEALRWLNAESA